MALPGETRRLTDPELDIAAKCWDGNPGSVARELQALRTSDRELRGMIKELVDVLDKLTEQARYYTEAREPSPGPMWRSINEAMRALTPSVRAIAERARKGGEGKE